MGGVPVSEATGKCLLSCHTGWGCRGGGAGRLGRLAPGLASPPSRNRSAPQSRHAGPHLRAEYVADACLAPHLRGQVPQCHTRPGIRVNVVLRMEAGRKEVWVQWPHQTVSPQSPGSSARSLEFVAATASHPPMLFLGGGVYFASRWAQVAGKNPPGAPSRPGLGLSLHFNVPEALGV